MTEKPQSESLDSRLDETLEMTFPASDPIAVQPPDPVPTRAPVLPTIPLQAKSRMKDAQWIRMKRQQARLQVLRLPSPPPGRADHALGQCARGYRAADEWPANLQRSWRPLLGPILILGSAPAPANHRGAGKRRQADWRDACVGSGVQNDRSPRVSTRWSALQPVLSRAGRRFLVPSGWRWADDGTSSSPGCSS